jgi:phosphopantetheinyl transferase
MSLKPADFALIEPFDAIGAGDRPACRMANWQEAFGGADTAMLTDAERTRAGRLRSPARQQEMTASFVLRRWLVADMTGCSADDVRLDAQESGAPLLLAPSGYAISLANKRTLTVVALDRVCTTSENPAFAMGDGIGMPLAVCVPPHSRGRDAASLALTQKVPPA